MIEKRLIADGSSTMELINDDVIIKITGGLLLPVLRVEGLDRHKQMVEVFRPISTDKELPKVRVPQYTAEAAEALLQYFFPMGDE
ncbi:hypothetical protein SDC9_100262 [bioreactor metagenome]|uniref:Uncharacterized protein n=1 Tax=bioreactor metagenome TaxID=1076179 RepID=A0A645AVB5_9ZZZZ